MTKKSKANKAAEGNRKAGQHGRGQPQGYTGREPETLSAEIDQFTLEKTIRRMVKSTSAEGTIIKESTKAVPPEKSLSALSAHIRETWTIDEILLFRHFTHCGTFSAPDGGWSIEYGGHIASTAEGMTNLVDLFDRLHAEVWAYMGAYLHGKMESDNPATLLCNPDATTDLGTLTLNKLIRKIPNTATSIQVAISHLNRKVDEMGSNVSQAAADARFLREYREKRIKENEQRGRDNENKGHENNGDAAYTASVRNAKEAAFKRMHGKIKGYGDLKQAAIDEVERLHLSVDTIAHEYRTWLAEKYPEEVKEKQRLRKARKSRQRKN